MATRITTTVGRFLYIHIYPDRVKGCSRFVQLGERSVGLRRRELRHKRQATNCAISPTTRQCGNARRSFGSWWFVQYVMEDVPFIDRSRPPRGIAMPSTLYVGRSRSSCLPQHGDDQLFWHSATVSRIWAWPSISLHAYRQHVPWNNLYVMTFYSLVIKQTTEVSFFHFISFTQRLFSMICF